MTDTNMTNTATTTFSATPVALATLASLQRWAQRLVQAGYRVIAPQDSPQGPLYAEWQGAPLALASGLPRLSPKEIWFPRSETVAKLRRQEQRWQLDTPAFAEQPTVILGARPCDAVALRRQMPVFLAPPTDEFFARRSSQIILVVLGCQHPQDEACFCTSVGVDPAGTNSGDVLLTPVDAEHWAATASTKRGAKLLALELKQEEASKSQQIAAERLWEASRAAVPPRFDASRVRRVLSAEASMPVVSPAFWEETSQGCQSCGACAFVCPTCHCFDLQEEVRGGRGGRLKNWDACTLPLFTRQASGFNPRPSRAARWQQRVEHKFRYYPQKHGEILCTGCGRCLRLCPGGVDLLDTLVRINNLGVNIAKSTATASTTASIMATTTASETTTETSAAKRLSLMTTHTSEKPTRHQENKVAPACDVSLRPISDTMSDIMSDTTAPRNIYASQLAIIADIVDETPTVRTLRLHLRDGEPTLPAYHPGQFAMVAALGEGEAPFCIASAPTRPATLDTTRPATLDITFRRLGRVTEVLSRLEVGEEVGLRAPLGHGFPVEDWQGKNLVLIGGGLGVTPLRALWQYCLDRRGDFGHLDILLGAKSLEEHCYRREWAQIQATPNLSWHWCIDPPAPEAEVTTPAECRRCFLSDLVRQIAPRAENSVAVVCGPPAMISLTIVALRELGFEDESIYLTLENRMKCGLGKCGRCNVGSAHVCQDGPVFNLTKLCIKV